jgi:hypothetical protein
MEFVPRNRRNLWLELAVEYHQKTVEIPISGDFKEPEIILSGMGNIDSCNSSLQLAIQGQKQNNTLVGKIQETASGTEGVFTANYQAPKKSHSSETH